MCAWVYCLAFVLAVTGCASQPGDTSDTAGDAVLLSDDASLVGLVLSSGLLDPEFGLDTTAYVAEVPSADVSLTVTPTAGDPAAAVDVQVNGVGYLGVQSGEPVGAFALALGANTVDVRVTAENGAAEVYTVIVTRLSDQALLSSLALSSGELTPAFAGSTTSYTVLLDGGVESLNLIPTALDDASAIDIRFGTEGYELVLSGSPTDDYTLVDGLNTFDVRVTAQDASIQQIYHLEVTRESDDVTLGDLALSEGTLTPAFDPETTSYAAMVDSASTALSVTPTAADDGAVLGVRMNGSGYVSVDSGSAAGPYALGVGTNIVDVWVASEDGYVDMTYTVAVTRSSAEARLESLVLSDGTLAPTFNSASTLYDSFVDGGTESITLTPTALDETSSIEVRLGDGDYEVVSSGIATSALALDYGPNTIDTRVTAQDGTTQKVYQVAMTRLSDDANLDDLVLSQGALDPTFDPWTTDYVATVSSGTSGITVTPYTSDAGALISVRLNDGGFVTVDSGADVGPLALSVGENWIDVIVDSEDGTTEKIYSVAVTRPSAETALSDLVPSVGTLEPSFGWAVNSYTVVLDEGVDAIAVTPTAMDASSTLDVRFGDGAYAPVTSGSASGDFSLATGVNTIDVRVTAESGLSQQIYQVTVLRQSGDASLSGLELSAGTLAPVFDAETTEYVAAVTSGTAGLSVTPTATDPGASVSVQVNDGGYVSVDSGHAAGVYALDVGANRIDVRVTAEDGVTVTTYSITVTRPSDETALSSLLLSEGTLSPTFSSTGMSYTALEVGAAASLTVTATAENAAATLETRIGEGDYTAISSGVASDALALTLGENTVSVRVTAPDGVTQRTYSVSVTRQSDDASLSSLTLSAGTLAPVFDAGVDVYAATVDSSTTGLSVTPTTTDDGAAVAVQMNAGGFVSVSSGDTAGVYALEVGDNSLDVRVTAEDGTARTYTVVITRPSDDAALSGLLLSDGTLSPSFDATTLTYTASVVSATTSMTVTPTTSHDDATIQVRVGSGAYASVASGTSSAALPLDLGDNTINVRVAAADGSARTYTVTVTRQSDDASLSGLTVSAGTVTPGFDSAVTSYALTVGSGTVGTTVTPASTDDGATIEVRANGGAYVSVASGAVVGAYALEEGVNTLDVRVTSEDSSSQQTYTVTVTRQSDDASLSGLVLSDGTLSPSFAAGTVDYAATVVYATSTLTVTPTANQVGATIEVKVGDGSYAPVTSGGVSEALALGEGDNDVFVLVTAEDGSTATTYRVVVTRQSADATLTSLDVSTGTLSPTFDPGTTSYSMSVANTVSSVSITPTSTDDNATVEFSVDGGTYFSVESGSAFGPVSLLVGDTSLAVRVTSEDASSQQIYTVTVRRRSVDAALSALAISSGSLTPSFDAGTSAYAATVGNAVTSVTITPTVNQAGATVEVQVNDGGYASVPSGSASGALALVVGDNTVDVRVTPEDGAPTRTYTVAVKRNRTYTVGGTVTGLISGTSVTLTNNGGDSLVVSYGDGEDDFNFGTAVEEGLTYTVAVASSGDLYCTVGTSGAHTGTVPESDVTNVAVSCGKLTFVTDTATDGSITVAGADAICEGEGDVTKAGTYVAWLSTSTEDAIDRITAGVRYILYDGTYFSDVAKISDGDDADGGHAATMSQNAIGTSVTNQRVWTGTSTVGTYLASKTCGDWTSNTLSGGYWGRSLGTGTDWTAASQVGCSNTHRLYCFQQ